MSLATSQTAQSVGLRECSQTCFSSTAQRAHRDLKKACRQRKRHRLLHGLQQIEQASQRGDYKAFHAFVKLVSPKPFVPIE